MVASTRYGSEFRATMSRAMRGNTLAKERKVRRRSAQRSQIQVEPIGGRRA